MSTSSGAGGSNPACSVGLTMCATCVDLGSDPQNCGACGNVCVGDPCISGVCSTGVVAPGAVGHAISLGLDYTTVVPGEPSARILGNAVFLAAHDPVRILDYRELTTWNSSTISNTVDLIADEAIFRGRDVTTTVAPNGAAIPGELASGMFDVLFVHSLDAAPVGSLGAIGAAWNPSALAFCAGGGVVVVIATVGGADQMPDLLSQSGLFVTSGLLDVGAKTLVVQGTADAMGADLPPALAPIKGASGFITSTPPGPALAFVVTSGSAPVVVHRAFY